MSLILVAIGVLLLLIGPLAIWRPRRFGLPSRAMATALWGFWIVPFGLGMDLDPPPVEPGQPPHEATFPGVLFVWIVFVLVGWAVRRAFKRDERSTSPTATVEEGIASIRRMSELAQPTKGVVQNLQRRNERAVAPRARRLNVLPARSTMPDLGDGETSDFASFSYVDERGHESERLLSDWWSEGRYIRGHCTMRGAERKFRKDRISEWRSW